MVLLEMFRVHFPASSPILPTFIHLHMKRSEVQRDHVPFHRSHCQTLQIRDLTTDPKLHKIVLTTILD